MNEDNGKEPRLGLRIAAHAAGGAALGYLLLHPCSMFVHHLQAGGHSWWHFLPMSFSLSHLPMAGFFALLGALMGSAYGFYSCRLAALCEEVRVLSITDPLTSLHNRRYFTSQLEIEIAKAKASSRELSMIMVNIDHFQVYNDRHGHRKGDQLVQTFARLMQETLRDTGIAARYSGAEFVAILPGSGEKAARQVAEALRSRVEAHSFPGEDAQPGGKLTMSAGVVELSEGTEDVDGLVGAAGAMLYKAKLEGRNKVH